MKKIYTFLMVLCMLCMTSLVFSQAQTTAQRPWGSKSSPTTITAPTTPSKSCIGLINGFQAYINTVIAPQVMAKLPGIISFSANVVLTKCVSDNEVVATVTAEIKAKFKSDDGKTEKVMCITNVDQVIIKAVAGQVKVTEATPISTDVKDCP